MASKRMKAEAAAHRGTRMSIAKRMKAEAAAGKGNTGLIANRAKKLGEAAGRCQLLDRSCVDFVCQVGHIENYAGWGFHARKNTGGQMDFFSIQSFTILEVCRKPVLHILERR